MRLSSLTADQLSGAQVLLAALLAMIGFCFLLPRPWGRFIPGGVVALIASTTGFAVWGYSTFGKPMPDHVGTILFCLFSLGTLGFGTVLVTQRNPARGAIAFAFVILSTCGLFLLLAAPFLMAATIIIYAGAIIVTFLFVLMLSQVQGPSDENDRSREPLFGALAGFAFTGLVLFTVYLSAAGRLKDDTAIESTLKPPQLLPAVVLTPQEKQELLNAVAKLDVVDEQFLANTPHQTLFEYMASVRDEIAAVVGSNFVVGSVTTTRQDSLRSRLEKQSLRPGELYIPLRLDEQAKLVLARATNVRDMNDQLHSAVENHFLEGKPNAVAIRTQVVQLRDALVLLAGSGDLPARNVSNLGYLLYADHLLAVELAGTLLLVATIGAVAIAKRRGVSA
jgi:NADH:ubiquinone oxidoreductase subunit 6 (subunit J)